jgi:hypothetical protein
VIKLLTLWAAWRLLRALAPILLAATIALLLLDAADHRGNAVGRPQHTTQPLEQHLQHTLQKAFAP